MKSKLSVTLDKEIFVKVAYALSNGGFRSRSHFVEYALKKLLEGQNG